MLVTQKLVTMNQKKLIRPRFIIPAVLGVAFSWMMSSPLVPLGYKHAPGWPGYDPESIPLEGFRKDR